MKKIFTKCLALLLCLCTLMLCACFDINDPAEETTPSADSTNSETEASETTSEEETTEEESTEEEIEVIDMKDIVINGKKLDKFFVLTEALVSPAGIRLKKMLKAGLDVNSVDHVDIAHMNDAAYSDMKYIRIISLPCNGFADTIKEDEARFFEKDGNFFIVAGSPMVSEIHAVDYLVEDILVKNKDLTGFDKVVKLDTIETILSDTATAAAQKVETILSAANSTKSPIGANAKRYYVSYSTGSDSNDGLSEATPWKTVDKVSQADIASGSVVLFKRGDEWRLDSYEQSKKATYLLLKSGVTYSAYGEGAKPIINGSPVDAAKEGTWTATGTPNVWVYSREYRGMYANGSNTLSHNLDDVGNIFFNGGEAYGLKMMTNEPERPFSGISDLKNEYEFYYNPSDSRVYLYCDQNPADKYESIEMGVRLNLVRATSASNITFDNFTIKNGGAHGISLAIANNVKITNCEIGWIGGGVYDNTADAAARYGNGIEINRDCRNITIKDNYIYQCFDAGVTHQFDGNSQTTCYQEDITYTDNVIKYCFYNIEYFVSLAKSHPSVVRYMKNITISNNYLMYAGFGWGYWREASGQPAATHIKGWNLVDATVVDGTMKTQNNYLVISRGDMVCAANISAPADVPNYTTNTFIQREGYTESNSTYTSIWVYRGVTIGTEKVDAAYRPAWSEDTVSANTYLKGKNNTYYTVK